MITDLNDINDYNNSVDESYINKPETVLIKKRI